MKCHSKTIDFRMCLSLEAGFIAYSERHKT